MIIQREYFEELAQRIFSSLEADEELNLSLGAESSQFIRLNGPRIRQSGRVDDCELEMTLFKKTPVGNRRGMASLTLTGLSYIDQEATAGLLRELRAMVAELAVDPYAVLPQAGQGMVHETRSRLLAEDRAAETLLGLTGDDDVSGIFASGPVVRAMANSQGLRHWFLSENWSLDYSMYTPEKRAVKATVAGQDWSAQELERSLSESRRQIAALSRPAIRPNRGDERVWLAPAAVGELLHLLSYGAFSERSIRQGSSPIQRVRDGRARFSSHFSLREDYTSGMMPRFNDQGELAPEVLPLVDRGALRGTLVHGRTAREYGIPSTGAHLWETLSSPAIEGGDLQDAQVLRRLQDGIWVSNLHYLNWSDTPAGRITGMTRYACFKVEKGEVIAPIENMRFDEGLFSIFGDALEAVGSRVELQPDVMTYGQRQLGGARCPGLLLSRFKFTI